jgi:hypothetical protein
LRGLLGLLLGAGLVWGLLEVSQLYPYSFTHGSPALPAVPAAPSQPVDLSISFIETAESQTVGTHLAQGLGWGKRRVAFRAALIRHPKGTILFGTGLSPEHNERHVGWKVGTPFAASKPLTSLPNPSPLNPKPLTSAAVLSLTRCRAGLHEVHAGRRHEAAVAVQAAGRGLRRVPAPPQAG